MERRDEDRKVKAPKEGISERRTTPITRAKPDRRKETE
jgi:hypothetical protein